jgi:diaminohydroxyphosphoribosylaminopyrimidine deaminase/5-amino-6-(5-phosphoribosylamino)uracil reductase
MLRAKVDAILIGRQTAMVDNPSLTVREVLGNNPKRIILDTNRTLPLNLNIFQDQFLLILILLDEPFQLRVILPNQLLNTFYN